MLADFFLRNICLGHASSTNTFAMCPLDEYAKTSDDEHDLLCKINAEAQAALEKRLARQSKEAQVVAKVAAEWGVYRSLAQRKQSAGATPIAGLGLDNGGPTKLEGIPSPP